MRSHKGNVLLTELVIAILFFSLSQVILVQVFAAAQSKALDSRRLNDAMLAAQNVAEQLAATAGTPDAVLLEMGFSGENGQYVYEIEQGTFLKVRVQSVSQPSGRLVTVSLSAMQGEKELFTWPSVRYVPAEVWHEQ